ncbi:hypothetical protein BDP55DRAFT_625111 [Colletotrichum godetiae]|uniref:Uncharacterized protein n=1 Tax=Colletotrichum godetiae TaxID=1209918 RepID=A0AAJ0AYV5_9PEZI|nr:uncharacterized protein BDP55DRAFT_625111 [Colletotrichum godetiae]KAK1700841.1 hypothetical protein BDP55DRAFT_625111 [Colletotrichum godetiae]
MESAATRPLTAPGSAVRPCSGSSCAAPDKSVGTGHDTVFFPFVSNCCYFHPMFFHPGSCWDRMKGIDRKKHWGSADLGLVSTLRLGFSGLTKNLSTGDQANGPDERLASAAVSRDSESRLGASVSGGNLMSARCLIEYIEYTLYTENDALESQKSKRGKCHVVGPVVSRSFDDPDESSSICFHRLHRNKRRIDELPARNPGLYVASLGSLEMRDTFLPWPAQECGGGGGQLCAKPERAELGPELMQR